MEVKSCIIIFAFSILALLANEAIGVPYDWNAKEAAGEDDNGGWLTRDKAEIDASSRSGIISGGSVEIEIFDETSKRAPLSHAANSSRASRGTMMIPRKLRRKRWAGIVFVQTLNLITGTFSLTVTGLNYATDGAFFYPSINEAKESIRRNKEWLDNNRDRLEKLRDDYTKTYEKYTNINIHYEGYKQAASIVINNSKHPVFTNPYIDEFLVTGVPSLTSTTTMTFQKIKFGTGYLLGVATTALSGMGLLGSFRTIRLMKVYQSRVAALDKDVGVIRAFTGAVDFMDDYYPKMTTMSKGQRVKAWLKNKVIPDCFRSNKHLNRQIHQADGDPLSIRNNKMMFGLATIGFGLQVASIVQEFISMRRTRDQFNEAANQLDTVVAKIKESDVTLPNEMKKMEDVMDDMARIVQYGLEKDGFNCQVNTDNVMFIAKTMKDVAVIVGNQGTKHIERYESIKSQIAFVQDMGLPVSPHRLYQQLIRQSRLANMEDDIEFLMRKAGIDGGTWAAWRVRGACSRVCGISVKTLARECLTGDNCIGRLEKKEVCDWSVFDEKEHQACVEDRKRQNPRSEEQTDLDKALELVCQPESKPTAYYTLKNKALGLVLALDKSNPNRVYLEREKSGPEENDNQIWRKEESQESGNFVLAAKYLGRVLKFDVQDNGVSMEWNLESSGRLKSARWFVEGQNCDSTNADSGEVKLSDVQNWANTPCQQWEIEPFIPPQNA